MGRVGVEPTTSVSFRLLFIRSYLNEELGKSIELYRCSNPTKQIFQTTNQDASKCAYKRGGQVGCTSVTKRNRIGGIGNRYTRHTKVV
jgi:hypothetical protein